MNALFALIYSPRFGEYSYGTEHPFKVQRYRLAFELVRELGLLSPPVRVVDCPPAPEAALSSFHRQGIEIVLPVKGRERSFRRVWAVTHPDRGRKQTKFPHQLEGQAVALDLEGMLRAVRIFAEAR